MPSLIPRGPSWTLFGLVLAFVDLWVAHALLCVSASIFFPSKLLNFLGLYLPCPCTGLLGYQSRDFCWHRLLIDWPIEIIIFVLRLVMSRFPFGLLIVKDLTTDVAVNSTETRHVDPSCSARTDDGGVLSDYKGKGIVRRRSKSVLQQRRTGFQRPAKYTPNAIRDSGGSCSANGSILCHSAFTGDDILDGGNALAGIKGRCGGEDEVLGKESKAMVYPSFENLSSDESFLDIHEKCRMLEIALTEVKTAHAAACSELEKERSAAATAAEEAMGMILRLQEDKSAMEMEARHYQRLIEEKFAYEEEEMGILKEILMKREKENLFLEKEIQCYKEMNSPVKELKFGNENSSDPKLFFGKDNQTLSHCDGSSNSDTENEVSTDSVKYVQSRSRSSHNSPQRAIAVCAGGPVNYTCLALQGLSKADCFSIDEQKQLKRANQNREPDSLETESTVHDIYTIDEKTVIWKENDQ